MFYRAISYIVGLAFAGVLLISLFMGVSNYVSNPPAPLPEEDFHKEPKALHLASDGAFGHFDKKQLQRGFQIYKEVCSACHSLSHVAFRDLEELGYNEAEVKAIANQWALEVPDINPETGEAATRKATPADRFPSPYANDIAARAANSGALPPDLSLITQAREGGAPYVYSILTGYQNPDNYRNEEGEPLPASAKPTPGLHFNPYFANLNIRMPPPLTSDGQVTYAPGNPAPTVDQMARDIAAFLVWAAEPNLATRHAAGVAVAIFLLFASILGYLAYRNIWAEAKRKVRVTGVLEPENQAKTRRAKRKQGVAG
ncbi:MAG TPA: cytochrome c1 [Sphingomicrobium sp.]|nr:cytochrome c1 [Sphingomicrobium sp.]